MFFTTNKMLVVMKTVNTLSTLLLLLTFSDVNASLPDSVCKSSLWNGITESMIKTSNSTARNVTNARIDCCNGEKGGWCGSTHSTNNWIEVDFDQGVGIRGLVLQKPEGSHAGYVTSVSLQFMLKGSTSWQYVSSDPTQAMPINALRDDTVSTTITINPGLVVTKFKINILAFQRGPCLRFDLLGCTNYEVLCPNTCLNGGQCLAENQCVCPNNYGGARCQNLISNPVCDTALGLESGVITDSMITVSSSAAGKPKDKVRYNCCAGEDSGAWCPASRDQHPWLEVRLTKPMAVSGLNFLHPSQKDLHTYPNMYMKTFQLKFISAMDPIREWRNFYEHIPSIYNSTLYYNTGLNPYIVTDVIRIYPETYLTAACFRLEIIGCDPSVLCSKDFCRNGGTCMGVNVCKCLPGFYGDSCAKETSNLVHLNLGFTLITQYVIHTNSQITLNIHGNAALVNSDNGKAISLTGNSYITVNNTGFNTCLKDVDTCSSGFTLTINVNLHQLTDNTYIVSSGGDLQNHKGIALFYKNHMLHFVVTTASHQWVITVPNTLTLNVWHKVELSWSKTTGSLLVIDNSLVGSVSQPQPIVAQQVKPLTIGHGYHHQVSISMIIRGLQTFDSHRENLIINGLITTFGPTMIQQTTFITSNTTETTTLPMTVKSTTQAAAITIASTSLTAAVSTSQHSSLMNMTTPLTISTQQHLISNTSDNMSQNNYNATKTRERSDIACNAENIEIFLPKNLLPLASRVTWSDPNCIITSNSTHYVSTVKHGECGTTVSLTANNVIFENEIKANPLTTTSHLLDFGTNPYVIPVKCIYPRKEMTLSSYQPVKQQVRVYEKRFGHLDIDMRQFETDQFSHALDNSTIPKLELNSDIFIKVRLQNFGSADLGIHLDTCIATKTSTPYDNMFIKLIENGCPKNNFVHLLPSPSRETRFSLRAFEFTSSRSNVVYIHCQASVCLANSSQCNPDCSSSDRTKRDVSSNPSHLLSMGPVVLVADSIPTSNLFANTVAGVSVAVAIVAMVIAAKEWRRKRTVDFSDNSLCRIKS